MRPIRKLVLLTAASLALVTLAACHGGYTPPEAPMPPNTSLLSQMMRELSAQPGFTEAMLAELDKGGKKGAALLTPTLIDELRKQILGKDWNRLDRFPGWSMREINPTVRIVGHEAGKSSEAENLSAVHPGSPAAKAAMLLDLGPYSLDKAETVSLDAPSTLPGFTTDGLVSTLGGGVTRGDGPNALAPEHAESQRLADVLNRLAANELVDGKHTFNVQVERPYMRAFVATPQDLVSQLAAQGNALRVTDTRYFANFGHFHYTPKGAAQAQDVMMPFWVNTGLRIPHTHGRKLLIPVSHAELEWHIRGHLNADVSYYFGVDGKSEWRTMDTLDQAWVLKRDAHTYTGAQAIEATRLAGLLTVAYMHEHAARPAMPFGGYYGLGVCQDGVSAIEKKLTGAVTLFPNTADAALFNDPRDAEVNSMIAAIPKDRDGQPPDAARIFGSLPAGPGPQNDFAAITIPGLAADLTAVHAATGVRSLIPGGRSLHILFIVILVIFALFAMSQIRRRNIHDF